MSSYISEHWRGEHSLTRALGLNTIVFNCVMVLVLSYVTAWTENIRLLPDNTILILLIVFWLCVLCWQAVGSFRAATRRIASYGSVSNYYIVCAIMLACGIFALGSIATQYGEKIDYKQREVDAYVPIKPTFNLTLDHSKQLVFTGDIGHGATTRLTTLMEQSPDSTLLILNSNGGLIAEARGLANTIRQYGLNTSVSEHCYSACTIAFIAGIERSLNPNATLGFHQYYLESKSPLPWIEPEIEQAKDLAYFQEKQVANWFMKRAYSTPHHSIWTPSPDVLLSAGVITTQASAEGHSK